MSISQAELGSSDLSIGSKVKALSQWFLLASLILLILGPIIVVFLESFEVTKPGSASVFGLENWRETFMASDLGPALWNTMTIVLTRGALGFMIAIPIAWLIARTDMPGGHWLEFGFWIAFFMPSLAFIQGWIFLLDGQRGLIIYLVRDIPILGPWMKAHIDVFSYWGIIFVHLMSQNVSTLVVLMALAFRNIDSSLEEAARIAGSSKWRTLGTIVLPLSRPALGMMIVLSVIRGMQSYEVEAVLGTPVKIDVYSTMVVNMLSRDPPNVPSAAVLSTLILAILVPLIFLQRWFVGKEQYTTVGSKMRLTRISLGPRVRIISCILVSTFVAIQTLVPFLATLGGSFMTRWGWFHIPEPWTLSRWIEVLSNDQFIDCLRNTLVLGLWSAFGAAAASFMISYILIRSHFSAKGSMEFVSWLPWAVPGVLLSLGLVTIVLKFPPLRIFYGSMSILVLSVILFRFPLNVQLIKSGLMQIHPELEEASVVCGENSFWTQMKITLPILMPMLIGVGLMTFVAAVNEVSGVVLLASTDMRTLSLLSLDYLLGTQPRRESAAVVTIIMLVLCVGVALIARSFGIRLGASGGAGPVSASDDTDATTRAFRKRKLFGAKNG
jgi:iron(III) transport system permease protein